MGVIDRIRRLERERSAKRPQDFVWGAVLTEVSPGLYAFDFPEHWRGRTARAQEIDNMHIPFVQCDFLNGKSKGWRN